MDPDAVRPLQRLLKSYGWDPAAMAATQQALRGEALAEPDGMLTVDSCEFPKQGTESVGVARQDCGARGKVENCQSGVVVGYASRKGYGLVTGRLDLPGRWFSPADTARREYNRVPHALVFQTKPPTAARLIETLHPTNRFPAQWIGCDATFGSGWAFLEALPQGKYSFASIQATTHVFVRKPVVGLPASRGKGRRPTHPRVLRGKASPVGQLARAKRCNWTQVVLAEGAKGPLVAEVATLRVSPSRDGLPNEEPVWLFLRRTEDGQLTYAFAHAPEDMPLSAWCAAATRRWPIEPCFQDGKSQVGMDHYEHRSWPAWHRHMLSVCLARHFRLRLRLRLKNPPGLDAPASAHAGGGSVAVPNLDARAGAGARALPHEAESPCVSLAQEAAAGVAS